MIPQRKNLKRGKDQDIFFSGFLLVLIILVAGFLVISNRKISQKREELSGEISRLKNEIQTLETKKQTLTTNISQVSQENYLEKEARENLGMKKPGEEVVVIKKGGEEEKKTVEEKNFWQRVEEKISSVLSPLQEKTKSFLKSLKFW